ncbi:Uncharacterised protein [Achromobacter insolitus]|uniref:hypothetical protein n=1 Tax=Achromobacter insolitus TaxID=217204 RepID=UPI000B51E1DD|nr:hypothetical protein [Achromobacter insolitus]OWT54981.1 hypothetical protein CEY08_25625 [Achromobacter insolitus]CAB3677888.1 hypothetical protein LMG6003_01442 [Achromobacter insolitus]VEG72373.1 Uncharacterised protein [Achromobacter insolitus]
MQNNEVTASNVLVMDRQQAKPKAAPDVLQTLLQSLREAEPVEPTPAAQAVELVPSVQAIKGCGNLQAVHTSAAQQQIEGTNNIQLSGLNVVVRLDIARNQSQAFGPCRSVLRVVAVVGVVALALLC